MESARPPLAPGVSKKIGIVTGGGDCPGLNAVIRAVAKAAAQRGWESLGILGGYDGLLAPQQFLTLDYKSIGGLLTRGGTILGTANCGRFSAKVGHGESRRQVSPHLRARAPATRRQPDHVRPRSLLDVRRDRCGTCCGGRFRQEGCLHRSLRRCRVDTGRPWPVENGSPGRQLIRTARALGICPGD
jgi:hypothetical protein